MHLHYFENAFFPKISTWIRHTIAALSLSCTYFETHDGLHELSWRTHVTLQSEHGYESIAVQYSYCCVTVVGKRMTIFNKQSQVFIGGKKVGHIMQEFEGIMAGACTQCLQLLRCLILYYTAAATIVLSHLSLYNNGWRFSPKPPAIVWCQMQA